MMPMGVRAGRLWTGALFALLLLAGCAGSEAAAPEDIDPVEPPRTTPGPAEAPEPTPTPTPSPSPTPTTDPREEALVELRATDDFLELAEFERAANARWARFGWDAFAPFEDGEKLFEWENKAELWDEIATPFRDECLLAGPQATRPMWDAEVLIPASSYARWSERSTGLGQFIEFTCSIDESSGGDAYELWTAALIVTDENRIGSVLSVMPQAEVRESEFTDLVSRESQMREHLWTWVASEASEDRR